MPHKHKRRFADRDKEDFDLAPTAKAAPLRVGKAYGPEPGSKKRKISKSGDQYADDTPKAFARLMAFKARGKGIKALDDGPKTKKQKQKQSATKKGNATAGGDVAEGEEDAAVDAASSTVAQQLKIMPGEKLSDFAQRVNQALPLSGLEKNRKKVAGVADHKVTRHEKRLKKLQAGWREEEARIRDKEAEALELAEEEQDELDAMWEDKTADLPTGKKKGGKGKKRLRAGEVHLKEEDPWEALKKKRDQPKGLHDVVQAPPTFDKVPREIFKVKNGAKVNVGNVPSKGGVSLYKREQLGEERQTIIDTYRKLMAAKKEGK